MGEHQPALGSLLGLESSLGHQLGDREPQFPLSMVEM